MCDRLVRYSTAFARVVNMRTAAIGDGGSGAGGGGGDDVLGSSC